MIELDETTVIVPRFEDAVFWTSAENMERMAAEARTWHEQRRSGRVAEARRRVSVAWDVLRGRHWCDDSDLG